MLIVFASLEKPPAAWMPSFTRLPGGSEYNPARLTPPLMYTMIGAVVGGGSNSTGSPLGGVATNNNTPAPNKTPTTINAINHQDLTIGE
jgi:hypothetical protein